MHIYTAKVAKQGNVIPPAFAQRGIDRHTQAPLSAVTVKGYATTKVVTYAAYKDNIATFISATSRNQVLLIGNLPGINFANNLIPLPFPPIVFALTDKIEWPIDRVKAQAKLDALLVKMEAISPKAASAGQYKKIISRPTSWTQLENVRDKLAMEAPVADNNELNIYYTKSYERIHHIITQFLRTNTYPCFSSIDEMEVDAVDDIPWEQPIQIDHDVSITGHALKTWAASQTDTQPKAKTANWFYQQSEIVIPDQDLTLPLSSIVPKAKPSPMPWTYNFGSPSQVPNMPGLTFPFFRGMLISDPTTLFKIVSRHFLGNFGETQVEVEAGIDRLRRDLDRGSGTELHIVLSHMFFLVDLALETQSRLFIVYSDQYLGGVLLGARFKIFTGLVWVAPETSAELQQSVGALATHSEAVTALLKIVHDVRKDGVPPVTAEDIQAAKDSSWALAEIIKNKINVRLDLNDDQETIFKLNLGLLSYKASYKDITAENITEAMKLMNLDDPITEPFHIFLPTHIQTLADVVNTRRGRILAAFGSQTFSFITGKGVRFLLPKPSAVSEPDPDGRLYLLHEGPSVLFVFRKPLQTVLDEFENLRDGTKDSFITVGSAARERAVEQRKACTIVDKAVIPVWNELVKFHAPKFIPAGTGAGKRKAGEELASGRPEKRMIEDVLDDFEL